MDQSESNTKIRVPFPFSESESLDPHDRIYRWVHPKHHCDWSSDSFRPTSNLWNPIGAQTATLLGFEKPAVSVHLESLITLNGRQVLDLADDDLGSECGVVWLTVAQIQRASQGTIGLQLDTIVSNWHGILFKKNSPNPKLSASQKRGLNSIVQTHNQVLRPPTQPDGP